MNEFYTHERAEQYHSQDTPFNRTWPLMTTHGVDIDRMRVYLEGRGLDTYVAAENGWYPSRNAVDSFLRIVIPANVTKPGHVMYQARAVSPNVHLRYQTPKGNRHGAIISVRAFPDDERSEQVVVIEGAMCALAVAELGIDGLALMGQNPGDESIQHLIKLVDKREVAVCLDSEAEAQSHAVHICMQLAAAGSRARVVKIPGYKDIADMPRKERKLFVKGIF